MKDSCGTYIREIEIIYPHEIKTDRQTDSLNRPTIPIDCYRFVCTAPAAATFLRDSSDAASEVRHTAAAVGSKSNLLPACSESLLPACLQCVLAACLSLPFRWTVCVLWHCTPVREITLLNTPALVTNYLEPHSLLTWRISCSLFFSRHVKTFQTVFSVRRFRGI